MITAGLTGSIGMGKTTTAAMFKRAGAAVFDADAAVHQLYSKGGAAVPILKAGIPSCIVGGAVDRARLSKALSRDPLLFPVLESFIHPLVAKMRSEAQTKARREGKRVFINDVPLLFETGMEAGMDKIIVVTASKDVQRERVLARAGMSVEKFDDILSRQLPDAQKRARADYIVRTDLGMDFAREHVHKIMQDLTALSDGMTHK